jgi:hypothetical protein
MRACDGVLLTPKQRERLNIAIRYEGRFHTELTEDFVVTILAALEQIGDKSAIPVVTQAARSAPSPRVREAAEECLPFLLASAERQEAARTLLRAADSTAVSPDVLLRPAERAQSESPEQLLRAANEDAS